MGVTTGTSSLIEYTMPADDIDWSGNGHSIREARLHTLSSIYIKSGVDGTRPAKPAVQSVVWE